MVVATTSTSPSGISHVSPYIVDARISTKIAISNTQHQNDASIDVDIELGAD